MMSEPSRLDLPKTGLLTFLREAHRANPSPTPVDGKLETMSDGSGHSLRGSFAFYDPATCSLRMYQGSFMQTPGEQWERYSGTWPRAGTMSGGILYRRQPLAPLTRETVSSSWVDGELIPGDMFPTPNAEGGTGYMSGSHRDHWHPTLESHVKLFPTPAAEDYGSNKGGGMGRTGPVRHSLESMARKGLWPTPTAQDAESSGSRNLPGSSAHAGVSLTDAVRTGNSRTPRTLWSTPTAQDAANTAGPSQFRRNSLPLNTQVVFATPKATPSGPDYARRNRAGSGGDDLATQMGGQLNPQFVEWLMGYPKDWTLVSGKRSGRASRGPRTASKTGSVDSGP